MNPRIQLHRLDDPLDETTEYRVVIDHVAVGRLAPGATAAYAVLPGPHTVQVTSTWWRSPELHLDLDGEQVVRMQCRPGARGLLDRIRVLLSTRRSVIELHAHDRFVASDEGPTAF